MCTVPETMQAYAYIYTYMCIYTYTYTYEFCLAQAIIVFLCLVMNLEVAFVETLPDDEPVINYFATGASSGLRTRLNCIISL